MTFDPRKPYDELPFLPPQADIEARPVMRKTITASRALAELRQAARLLPNQDVLINTLPLLEAQSSSRLENIVTTTDELFRLASKESAAADPAAKEAYRYRTALREGCREIKSSPLGASTAVTVCSALLGEPTELRTEPGTCLGNASTGEVIYTPPHSPELLQQLLANWQQFLHAPNGIDPLIRLAVLHYQFEAIHPFPDGNGRTGRILNILVLIYLDLLDIPVLYPSRYILRHRADYYDHLLAVTRDNAWEPWILYMLDALEETALATRLKIDAIRRLMDHTAEFMRTRLPKIYSRELNDAIFTQPYCRIANLVNAGIAKRQTASVYLKALVEIGILQEEQSGRDKLFVHPKFLHLLTRDASDFDPYLLA